MKWKTIEDLHKELEKVLRSQKSNKYDIASLILRLIHSKYGLEEYRKTVKKFGLEEIIRCG